MQVRMFVVYIRRNITKLTAIYGLQQVNKLAISPDKRFLAAAGNGTVKLYDIATSAASSGGANVGPVSRAPPASIAINYSTDAIKV